MTADRLRLLIDAAAARDASPLTFEDGGQYRIEIPSVEGPAAFEAVIEAARTDGVPLHRISQGSGITLLRDEEIRRYVELGAEHQIEVCLFVGPRAPWTAEAASALAPDGKYFGWRHLSVGALKAAFDDVQRAADLGVRSVLVSDEGLISLVHQARIDGRLPAGLIMKGSAILGVANPLGALLLADAGLDTINIPADTRLDDLAAYRSCLSGPLDLYIESPDGLGGFMRYHDLGEIVRIGAPVHLKFGLRNAPNIYPSGEHLNAVAISSARERVRRASIGLEHLRRQYPSAVPSPLANRVGVPEPSR